MTTIPPAMEYRTGELGSRGNAMRMLLRQHRFPIEYDEKLESHAFADSDRLLALCPTRVDEIFLARTGLSLNSVFETPIENWFLTSDPDLIRRVAIEVMTASGTRLRHWTGFRILGSVGGNGYAVWSFELFAKHPKSATVLYDTETVPNLSPMPHKARGTCW